LADIHVSVGIRLHFLVFLRLNVLLYGDEGESHETNSFVFQQVQLFMKETGRFID
jgi:cytochrome b561